MRYIDADKIYEEFKSLEQLARKRVNDTPTNSPAYERYSTQYYEREKALSIIKAQPTADVVEVVRCKDCVYADCLPSGLFRCRKHSEYSMFRNSILNVRPDDYCSFGEKRTDDER